MMFDEFWKIQRLQAAWEQVRIVRAAARGLFTFGSTELAYYLVTPAQEEGGLVSVAAGEVHLQRPLILTPQDAPPELQDFLDDESDAEMFRFLLARQAQFTNLKLCNRRGPVRLVTDTVEESVARLVERLDQEDETDVAVLTAPVGLGGMAVLRYAVERILHSAPDNIQELRERGFLP